ncbi:hypothetical protein OROHE_009816 [Orobanche hederae]
MELPPPPPEYHVGAKRRKLSQEEEDDDVKHPRAKLCIITFSFSMDGGGLGHDIFVTDLDAAGSKSKKDGFIPIAPTLRLDTEGTYEGFCVLGSTLYIFESTGLLSDSPPLKTVYIIDLLSNPSLKRLGKSELCAIGDMNHPKTSPLASPTHDGKEILTFSASVRFDPFATSRKTVGENDFELYDLNVRKWHTLQGLPYDWLFHGKANFYNLEIGINMRSMYPHFVINTLTCDLAKYREDKEKGGGSAQLSAAISIGDFFKFYMDESCESFFDLGFFSF